MRAQRMRVAKLGGLPNMTVVVIKGVLYAIALTGLALSARSAIAKQI